MIVMLFGVMSCLDTAVVPRLETGPLMLSLWCHISCSASCRIFYFGMGHVLKSDLVLWVVPIFLSRYVLLSLLVSCHVVSSNDLPSQVLLSSRTI